jgi:hypothetical protein
MYFQLSWIFLGYGSLSYHGIQTIILARKKMALGLKQHKQLCDMCKFCADKPQIEELHQFLEFQLPRQWAPVYSDLPLGPQRKRQSTVSLPVNLIGPKLYVCTNMVCIFFLLS